MNVWDAIIVGAGPAGLTAALTLGRSCRTVLVVEDHTQRNRVARHMQGFPSRDGVNPLEFLQLCRQDLDKYGVHFHGGAVQKIHPSTGGLAVETTGSTFMAKKVLLASGVKDLLPPWPGLEKHWGTGVIHCPYCHGWEVRHTPLLVYGETHSIADFAALLTTWSNEVTLLVPSEEVLREQDHTLLKHTGVQVIPSEVQELLGDRALEGVKLKGGRVIPTRTLYLHPEQQHRLDFLQPWLNVTRADDLKPDAHGRTSIPGLFVAGDISHVVHTQLGVAAAAGGAVAAMSLNRSLFEDNLLGL